MMRCVVTIIRRCVPIFKTVKGRKGRFVTALMCGRQCSGGLGDGDAVSFGGGSSTCDEVEGKVQQQEELDYGDWEEGSWLKNCKENGRGNKFKYLGVWFDRKLRGIRQKSGLER